MLEVRVGCVFSVVTGLFNRLPHPQLRRTPDYRTQPPRLRSIDRAPSCGRRCVFSRRAFFVVRILSCVFRRARFVVRVSSCVFRHACFIVGVPSVVFRRAYSVVHVPLIMFRRACSIIHVPSVVS